MKLSLQDLSAILACVLGPMGTLIGFMWYHFNNKFEKLDHRLEKLDEKIDSVEKKLGEKIDAVRDRVSRIEGQLSPASIVTFKPATSKETAHG